MTRAAKQRAVIDALLMRPALSNRRIAASIGVDGKTVGDIRSWLIFNDKIPQLSDFLGCDGKYRPATMQHRRKMGLADANQPKENKRSESKSWLLDMLCEK